MLLIPLLLHQLSNICWDSICLDETLHFCGEDKDLAKCTISLGGTLSGL